MHTPVPTGQDPRRSLPGRLRGSSFWAAAMSGDLSEALEALVRAIAAQAAQEALAAYSAADLGSRDDRLAYTEPEAAQLLGVRSHVLRDARLRGELTGRRAGKRVIYDRRELLRWLAAHD